MRSVDIQGIKLYTVHYMVVNVGLKMTGCSLSAMNKDSSASYEFIVLYANFVNYFETVIVWELGKLRLNKLNIEQ